MLLPSLILLYVVLLVVLALVSAMETATSSVRDFRQTMRQDAPQQLREEVQAILANPFHHLHRTLLVSATLNLALTALGIYLVTQPLRRAGVSVWLGGGAIFGVTVLVGDVLPKLLAAWKPVQLLFLTTRLLSPVRAILDPLTAFAERASDRMIHFLLPNGVKTRHFITRDELETLIEMRQKQGAVTEVESAMLAEVLEMTDFTVKDCMTPRTQLALVDASLPESAMRRLLDKAQQRFAVLHDETPDEIHGVIDVRLWKLNGCPDVRKSAVPPVYVHETANALETFHRYLLSSAGCVVILDEYGGLEGMLTQDEVLDWVLYDAAPWEGEELEIQTTADRRVVADGSVRISDAAAALGADLPVDEDIDTIGGLVMNEVGYLPSAGRRVVVGNVQMTVKRVSKRRVQSVELKLLEAPKRQATGAVPV
jgi:putative hemolysin